MASFFIPNRGGQDILILTRSWQYQDFLSWQGIWQYQDFLILILVLNKALEEYWYWLLNPRQYQDILILKLILNKAFEEYWYWLLSPRQYQDILILKLILYKVLEEYWYWLRNHNQYQDILILNKKLKFQVASDRKWLSKLIIKAKSPNNTHNVHSWESKVLDPSPRWSWPAIKKQLKWLVLLYPTTIVSTIWPKKSIPGFPGAHHGHCPTPGSQRCWTSPRWSWPSGNNLKWLVSSSPTTIVSTS